MSRAEKRRQRRLAKKSRHLTPASRQPTGNILDIQQTLDLAIQHHKAGDLTKAEGFYQEVLHSDPNQTVALNMLGLIASQANKHEVAVEFFTKGLVIQPNLADGHFNLGNALQKLGRLDEAVASYHKALAIKSDYVNAHNNIGNVFNELGRLDEAVISYKKALAINPDYASAHYHLGLVFQKLGQDEALTSFRQAVFLKPHNDLFWTGFAEFLETFSFTSVDDKLWEDLLLLLERPTVRSSYVVRPIISALHHHPDFSQIVELIGSGEPEIGVAYRDIVGRLLEIPLFLRIMELSHICDLKIERMLTVLRRHMIKDTVSGEADVKGLRFSVALALQCFTNEYVFSETDEEKADVELLKKQIATLMKQERDVPASLVVSLGTYRPLYSFPWAKEFCERDYENGIKDVVERQILEPLEERSLRDQIPRLTSIRNTISQSVRAQYEESPYPRWFKTNIWGKGKAIGAILQEALPHLDIEDYPSPKRPEILVAGCGTGQHSLNTASMFLNAHVFAVDLSLSSLSYAMRKTKELGISNIEYAQADIMEMGGLGRQFDLIESGGVLHHLGDPLAGWRVLVDMLRPGGLMKIGLYSEIARQDVIRGRSLIAEKDYTSSPEDIRRCRQEIIALAEGGNPEMAKLRTYRDFYSSSECRDLLFHVQEHRFTLPQIEAALDTLNLEFLGFEIRRQGVLKMFVEMHRNENALTSLSLWHEFERENPYTFQGMYQFWCKKL